METLTLSIQRFCTTLRLQHGFALGPGETRLALQAAGAVGLASERHLRAALRAVCCGRAEQLPVFEAAFGRHFLGLGGPRPQRQDEQPPLDLGWNAPPAGPEHPDNAADDQPASPRSARASEKRVSLPQDDDSPSPAPPGSSRHDPDNPGDGRAGQLARARASGGHGTQGPPALSPPDDVLLHAARQFLSRLHLRPARRWTPAHAGARLDARRTLRAAMRTGGEALRLHWRWRPRWRPGVVLLIDASRSMDAHALDALRFAAALSRASERVHTFSFSTQLLELSAELRRPGAALPALRAAWGGGTRIGENLQTFLREHGDRLLGRSVVVLVVSDGLEVGDVSALASAAQELARRSGALVWLNPLARHPRFQPTARGMQAVWPHLALLAHADTPAEYAALRIPF